MTEDWCGLSPLMLNLRGSGVADALPLASGDYIADMFSGQIDGDEWLFLMTAQDRFFIAQANDAGGLNVQEIRR